MTASENRESPDPVQLGILALLAAIREEQGPQELAPKTEVLLESAGLPPAVIATALGKQPSTVRATLSRARSAGGSS
jgi:DNA-directed RNA polymerase specialized sigma24 family protein